MGTFNDPCMCFSCKVCHQDPLKLEVKLPRVDREDRKGVEATRVPWVPLNGEETSQLLL